MLEDQKYFKAKNIIFNWIKVVLTADIEQLIKQHMKQIKYNLIIHCVFISFTIEQIQLNIIGKYSWYFSPFSMDS